MRKLWLFCVLLLAGCGSGNNTASSSLGPAPPVPSPTPPVLIVDAAQAVSQQRLLVVAQSSLESGPALPLGGAAIVNVDEWETYSLPVLADTALTGWGQRIGALGITPATKVAVYDDGEMKFASRVRYLLSHYGVADAVMINGGMAALQPLVGGTSSPPPATSYNPQVLQPPIPLVSKAEVAAALSDPNLALLDVRTPAEYNGQLLLPGDARPGHIPGARNLPMGNIFSTPTTIMATSDLITYFTGFGLTPTQRIICYCHDGAKSSLVATALVQAGYVNVSLYYDSYKNWSEDSSLPVQL